MTKEIDDKDKRIEVDVKKYFLSCKHLFNYLGELGDTRVVYEKEIMRGRVRADVMLFTEFKGIIGVEFKTAPDTLKRLPRQLKNYAKVCSYVFVFCHDSHLAGVEKVIADLGMTDFVGIISYSVFEDKIIAGLYKEAQPNPNYDLSLSLDMLWRKDIAYILTVATHKQLDIVKNNFKTISMNDIDPSGGSHNHILKDTQLTTRRSIGSGYLSKKALTANYINAFGNTIGTEILCLAFIYPTYNPEKYLKIYNFGDTYGKYNENK